MGLMRLSLVVALLAAPGPFLQAQTSLDGKWRATFATEGSEGREAELVIQGGTGTWTTNPRANKDKRDVCIGRAFPIALTNAAASTLALHIESSKAVERCKDRKARLTIIDDKTLEGKFDNGLMIRLVRL